MITITTHPKGTYVNDIKVQDELAAALVRKGRLVKVISDTKVVIRPSLETPGIWKLPLEILKKVY